MVHDSKTNQKYLMKKPHTQNEAKESENAYFKAGPTTIRRHIDNLERRKLHEKLDES
jgi:hypothetical protein